MSDHFPDLDEAHEPTSAPPRGTRRGALAIGALVLVLVTVAATLAVQRFMGQHDGPVGQPSTSASDAGGADRPSELSLPFGAQDVAVAEVTVPAGAARSALLLFDVDVDPTPTSSARAAMVSFRMECRDGDEAVEMQTTGKVSTNVFLAQGGSASGQALTAETGQELRCTLLASAPFVEATEDGLTSLPVRADLRVERTDGTHVPGLHWLDDATLFEPGTSDNVLSRQIDDPAMLDRMSSTVRLTSCTVVGGSRDAGENKCQESMTGKESSTVRIRVIARWLDAEGSIASTSTFWDETLAIDYSTHHVPWTLRQDGMADDVPENAAAVVIVVQVESLFGTPVVVHADGTDSVITTRAA